MLMEIMVFFIKREKIYRRWLASRLLAAVRVDFIEGGPILSLPTMNWEPPTMQWQLIFSGRRRAKAGPHPEMLGCTTLCVRLFINSSIRSNVSFIITIFFAVWNPIFSAD